MRRFWRVLSDRNVPAFIREESCQGDLNRESPHQKFALRCSHSALLNLHFSFIHAQVAVRRGLCQSPRPSFCICSSCLRALALRLVLYLFKWFDHEIVFNAGVFGVEIGALSEWKWNDPSNTVAAVTQDSTEGRTRAKWKGPQLHRLASFIHGPPSLSARGPLRALVLVGRHPCTRPNRRLRRQTPPGNY